MCAAESVLQPKGTQARKHVRVGKIERHPEEKHPKRYNKLNIYPITPT